jgi:hypothetical protein
MPPSPRIPQTSMQQAYRIALIGLLALMQLFAPLVHAHTGGGQFSGAIHVPGLEFLSKPNGTFAQALVSPDECQDVIIGLAPGLKIPGNHVVPTPAPDIVLSVIFSFAAGLPAGLPAFPPPRDLSLLQASWLKPSPRAPPRLG